MVVINEKEIEIVEGKKYCADCEAKDKKIKELKEKIKQLENVLQK